MARKTISSAQLHAINSGYLDLMGEENGTLKAVRLGDLADTLVYLGALYSQKLSDSLTKSNSSSSGEGADSIIPQDVKIFGSIYTVEISANKYLTFIDEGVDGWFKSRGSKHKFKTKGVDPNGAMVKAVKAWLIREGSFVRNIKMPSTKREAQQKSIRDASTRQAISTAYMIKRQGIKPTHFWRDATKEMRAIVDMELGKALKVDIINNITA
jgi:hypothetical protein